MVSFCGSGLGARKNGSVKGRPRRVIRSINSNFAGAEVGDKHHSVLTS